MNTHKIRTRNPIKWAAIGPLIRSRVPYIMIINPLKTELNPICHLLALLGAHHILHFSMVRVNTENKKWGAGVDWLEFVLWLLNLSTPS